MQFSRAIGCVSVRLKATFRRLTVSIISVDVRSDQNSPIFISVSFCEPVIAVFSWYSSSWTNCEPHHWGLNFQIVELPVWSAMFLTRLLCKIVELPVWSAMFLTRLLCKIVELPLWSAMFLTRLLCRESIYGMLPWQCFQIIIIIIIIIIIHLFYYFITDTLFLESFLWGMNGFFTVLY
jgi:hypothetical protein